MPSAENFIILHGYPDPALEEAWVRCSQNGDMPTHFAAPEYFREPSTGSEQRFAVLAIDSDSPDLRVVGAPVRFYRGATAEYAWNASAVYRRLPPLLKEKLRSLKTV